MTWMPPFGALAICRIAAMVPIGFRSSGSRIVVVGGLQRQEQQPIAGQRAVTASIDIGRLIASGCSVSGKTTVSRSASTGSSLG